MNTSDAITGSLINILATIPKLRVMQSAVFRYKGREIYPQAIGRELNVRALLRGEYAKRRLFGIGAELVDVATGSLLWGAQTSQAWRHLCGPGRNFQRDIGETTAPVDPSGQKKLTKRHTENAEAYKVDLKGRHHWNQWTEEGFYKAIDYFLDCLPKVIDRLVEAFFSPPVPVVTTFKVKPICLCILGRTFCKLLRFRSGQPKP